MHKPILFHTYRKYQCGRKKNKERKKKKRHQTYRKFYLTYVVGVACSTKYICIYILVLLLLKAHPPLFLTYISLLISLPFLLYFPFKPHSVSLTVKRKEQIKPVLLRTEAVPFNHNAKLAVAGKSFSLRYYHWQRYYRCSKINERTKKTW